MNQGMPLSWGCIGNALSNQRSIDDEETTCSLDKDAWLNVWLIHCFIQQHKALPDQSGKGKKLSKSGISIVYQSFFVRVYYTPLIPTGPHQATANQPNGQQVLAKQN